MLDAPLSNGVHIINGTLNDNDGDGDIDVVPGDVHSPPPPTSPSDGNTEVKIDLDLDQSEPDAHDLPPPALSLKFDAVENASHVPQVGTPADPGQYEVFCVVAESHF